MHLALAEAIVREKKSKKNEIENPIPKAIQIKSNTRKIYCGGLAFRCFAECARCVIYPMLVWTVNTYMVVPSTVRIVCKAFAGECN